METTRATSTGIAFSLRLVADDNGNRYSTKYELENRCNEILVNVYKHDYFLITTHIIKKMSFGQYHFLVVRDRGGFSFSECFFGILRVFSVGTDN